MSSIVLLVVSYLAFQRMVVVGHDGREACDAGRACGDQDRDEGDVADHGLPPLMFDVCLPASPVEPEASL